MMPLFVVLNKVNYVINMLFYVFAIEYFLFFLLHINLQVLFNYIVNFIINICSILCGIWILNRFILDRVLFWLVLYNKLIVTVWRILVICIIPVWRVFAMSLFICLFCWNRLIKIIFKFIPHYFVLFVIVLLLI